MFTVLGVLGGWIVLQLWVAMALRRRGATPPHSDGPASPEDLGDIWDTPTYGRKP